MLQDDTCPEMIVGELTDCHLGRLDELQCLGRPAMADLIQKLSEVSTGSPSMGCVAWHAVCVCVLATCCPVLYREHSGLGRNGPEPERL
jgi:hypothetical protein